MNVRCNNCMAVFDEGDIPINDNDEEYCPECGATGCLMDLEVEQ